MCVCVFAHEVSFEVQNLLCFSSKNYILSPIFSFLEFLVHKEIPGDFLHLSSSSLCLSLCSFHHSRRSFVCVSKNCLCFFLLHSIVTYITSLVFLEVFSDLSGTHTIRKSIQCRTHTHLHTEKEIYLHVNAEKMRAAIRIYRDMYYSSKCIQ